MLEIFGLDDDFGLSLKDQIKEVRKFLVQESSLDRDDIRIGAVGLMYYCDKFGNFLDREKFKSDLIANAIFHKLSTEDKMMVLEYLEFVDESKNGDST